MDEKKVDGLDMKLAAMRALKKVEPMVHKMEKMKVEKWAVKRVQMWDLKTADYLAA